MRKPTPSRTAQTNERHNRPIDREETTSRPASSLCGLRHPFRRLLPAGLGDGFGDEITDPFNQFSRALVGQNAALDLSLIHI